MTVADDRQSETLKEVVDQLLTRLSVSGKVEVVVEEEGGLQVNITSNDSALLIGWRGGTLAAFEYLVRVLFSRTVEAGAKDLPEIHVDVGGYKQRQVDELAEFARKVARDVTKSGAPDVLRPMNAFERRIVHMALKDISDVTTESIGADPNRRIVVKPNI